MTAQDLGKLLQYSVEYGAIPLTQLREVFSFFKPEDVSVWVGSLEALLKKQRPLTIDVFIAALDHLRKKIPDALTASHLASVCRETLGAKTVTQEHVLNLARGLAILVPDLIGIEENNKIIVNARAEHVARAIEQQLHRLRAAEAKNSVPEPGTTGPKEGS